MIQIAKKQCSADGCDRPSVVTGMCQKCYQAQYRENMRVSKQVVGDMLEQSLEDAKNCYKNCMGNRRIFWRNEIAEIEAAIELRDRMAAKIGKECKSCGNKSENISKGLCRRCYGIAYRRDNANQNNRSEAAEKAQATGDQSTAANVAGSWSTGAGH